MARSRVFGTLIQCWLIFFTFLPLYGEEGTSVDELIQLELISDYDTYSEGIRGWLGIKVMLAPKWHVYWKNSGESGYPTTVTWDVPSGIEIEPLEYPAPHLHSYDGLSSYIIKDEFWLLASFRVSPTIQLKKGETLKIKGLFDALVCNESTCLPFNTELTIPLIIEDKPEKKDTSDKKNPLDSPLGLPKSFAERVGFPALRAIPDYPPAEFQVKATGSGNRISLIFASADKFLSDLSKTYFFPSDPQFSTVQKETGDDGDLRIFLLWEMESSDSSPAFLEGVLTHPDLEPPWRIYFPIEEIEADLPTSLINNDQQMVDRIIEDKASSVSSFTVLWILLGLVIIGMSAWGYGKSISASQKNQGKWQVFSLTVFLLGIWVGYPKNKTIESSQSLSWETWSQSRQDQLLEEGHSVYVDFTAKWCLSCQVNKRVFTNPEVMDAIQSKDITLLRADWTKRGPDILRALQSYDREGVPLNIFFLAGKGEEPVVLPEILSKDVLLSAFEEKDHPVTEKGEYSFLVIFGFAWLGGLILNLMPCVFPVIGLKVMSFVKQAGENSNRIMHHAWVFVVGVVLSFWLLLGILLFLREGLQVQVGWGFQLQEPSFVFGLAVLLFLLALNLSGVFEIGMRLTGTGSSLSQKSGYLGSFFSGVLATVVATPCMAPFLGVAIGTALTMEILPAFTVFTSVAFGLASPYLILSMFPQWLSRLPKPGAWMETFKQFLAFPLYATVVWLIWTLAALL